jgi:hypothetical protein
VQSYAMFMCVLSLLCDCLVFTGTIYVYTFYTFVTVCTRYMFYYGVAYIYFCVDCVFSMFILEYTFWVHNLI